MADTPFRFRDIAVTAFGPSLFFSLGEGAVLPMIALSARADGASLALAGLIVGLIGIGSFISNIPSAMLIAHYGERWSMVGASALSVLALELCLVPRRLPLLMAGVALLGMATSVLLLARQTYMIDIVPDTMRARAMSSLGGMRRIGTFVGPFLGAAAEHAIGLAGAYWVGIVAISGAGVLAYLIPDVDRTRPDAVSATKPSLLAILRIHRKTYATLGFGILLISALRASRQIVIPLWAEHLGIGAAATAVIYGLVSSVDMLMFYPSGKAMDQYGRFWVAVPCALMMGSAIALIPAAAGPLSFVLIAMAIGLGNGIGSGLVMTVGADMSPAVGRTEFLGVWRMFADAGSSAAPLLISAITALASLAAGIIATGALGFVAAAIFWRWLPRSTAFYRRERVSREHDVARKHRC